MKQYRQIIIEKTENSKRIHDKQPKEEIEIKEMKTKSITGYDSG